MKTLRRRLVFAATWVWVIEFLRDASYYQWTLAGFFTGGLALALLFTFLRPARWL